MFYILIECSGFKQFRQGTTHALSVGCSSPIRYIDYFDIWISYRLGSSYSEGSIESETYTVIDLADHLKETGKAEIKFDGMKRITP